MIVGVIGIGMVGKAVYRAFADKIETIGYDVVGEFANEEFLSKMISTADLIFVCVPSPTYNGKQDLTILESVIKTLKDANYPGVVCIKCTVSPETTNRLKAESGLRLTHNPEFLTAAKAYEDFMAQKAIIVGGNALDSQVVANAYQCVFPGVPCLKYYDSTITEVAKYMRNVYLAMKVAFSNEIYGACEKLGIDYSTVVEALMSQGGIEPGHFKVPGFDGKRGYSGACFPKDVRALLEFLKQNDLNCKLIEAVEESNQMIRPHDTMCKEIL
jgi:nucleotide sugar dehydrogenase